MKANEILDGIKKLVFGDEMKPEVEMKEYALDNGTKVMISDLAVGGSVKLEDGSPAPVGGHTLADGTKIEVSEGGVIAAVTAPQAPAEDEMKLETPQQMMAAISKFAEPNAQVDMAKMALILKACFENVFGWQIREAQEKATRDAAIEAYKTGFEKQDQLNQKFISILDTLVQPEPEPQKTGLIKNHESKQSKLDKAVQLLKK